MTHEELNDLYQRAAELHAEKLGVDQFVLNGTSVAGIRAVVDLALAETNALTALGQLVLAVRDGDGDTARISGVLIARCDEDGKVDAQHAQAPAPWDTLRAAADTTLNRGHDPRTLMTILDVAEYLCQQADRLEAAHLTEQEKAAAEKAREALIENAARTMAAAHNPGVDWAAMGQYGRESFIAGARVLADAGLLADPDVEVDQ